MDSSSLGRRSQWSLFQRYESYRRTSTLLMGYELCHRTFTLRMVCFCLCPYSKLLKSLSRIFIGSPRSFQLSTAPTLQTRNLDTGPGWIFFFIQENYDLRKILTSEDMSGRVSCGALSCERTGRVIRCIPANKQFLTEVCVHTLYR